MTHTYNVKGMSCGGCKASVEKFLGNVENVTNVSVNLEKAEAEVTMSSHVATETLKRALPEKFILSEKVQEKSKSQQ
ncbi:heavy-metal-associated domain-containing protein [Aequorivita lipolytica]|uniref:Heavy-metal-associated domain-containing protein n=1 Tax=Aequorivita lipolytica TaxID=153267 RepID=A0A5C6YTG1_9FLAO|nr:heavy metal-associated domain-containing protein [Aequorivita lipolytica]TXD70738.1 heavy-metal-associated domain-containing protein [Aequorivita lipolytica]SRX49780.1 Copper chaperone CopZ [Aequorivita lipolytica]